MSEAERLECLGVRAVAQRDVERHVEHAIESAVQLAQLEEQRTSLERRLGDIQEAIRFRSIRSFLSSLFLS